MSEQRASYPAAAMLRSNADSREVGGIVLLDHDKRKTHDLARFGNDAVAQRSRLVQQVFKCVLGVIIAISETA